MPRFVGQKGKWSKLVDGGSLYFLIALVCAVIPFGASPIVILNYMDMYLYLGIVEDMDPRNGYDLGCVLNRGLLKAGRFSRH